MCLCSIRPVSTKLRLNLMNKHVLRYVVRHTERTLILPKPSSTSCWMKQCKHCKSCHLKGRKAVPSSTNSLSEQSVGIDQEERARTSQRSKNHIMKTTMMMFVGKHAG